MHALGFAELALGLFLEPFQAGRCILGAQTHCRLASIAISTLQGRQKSPASIVLTADRHQPVCDISYCEQENSTGTYGQESSKLTYSI